MKKENKNIKEPYKFESKSVRDVQDYIKERVEHKIDVYYRKSKWNRFYYYLFSVIIGVSSAMVPVLINIKDASGLFPVLATILSVTVTISVALQEIFRYREHWRNYNLIETNLRKEEMLFSTSSGPYAEKMNNEDRFIRFVNRIEDLIESERMDTILMRTSKVPDRDEGTITT